MQPNEKKFKAILKRDPQKTLPDGTYYGRFFYEIEHYFNDKMEEIEMVSFPQSPFEKHTTFEVPRIWDDRILKDYMIVPVP